MRRRNIGCATLALLAACGAQPKEPAASAGALAVGPSVCTTCSSVAPPPRGVSEPAPAADAAPDASAEAVPPPNGDGAGCQSDADCFLGWQYTCEEIYHCRSYRCGNGTPVALPVGAAVPEPRCDPKRQLPCRPSPCALPEVEPRATCRSHRCVFEGTWPPDTGY